MAPIASLFADLQKKATATSKKTLPEWIFDGFGSRRPIAPFTHETRLSASKIHDLCPRFETMRAEKQIITYDEVRPELQWIFDVGKLYHSLYRDWYMGPRGVYYGRWKCLACGWNTDGEGDDSELTAAGTPTSSFLPEGPFPNKRPIRMVPMPEQCGGCGGPRRGKDTTVSGRVVEDDHPLIVFDEWPMVNEEFGIHAKSDGWRMVLALRKLRNQEVKSISFKGYQTAQKQGAQPKHKTQGMICTWMSGMDTGEIVYLCKAAWMKPEDFVLPVVIPLDMEWMETYVFNPITTMRKHLKAGTVAPRICASEHDARAKECDLGVICFQEKNG
jgi:hypothetical protein